jgi:mono/diheme cytochrome c family protein
MTSRSNIRVAAILCGTALCGALSSASHAAQETTAAAGIYTEAQAARGLAVYQKQCTYCHHDDLLGGEDLEVVPPALVGASFGERWYGKSVADMFRAIATTMPWRGKGLTPAEYADVVSYLLKENGYKAGRKELPADSTLLERVLITEKR